MPAQEITEVSKVVAPIIRIKDMLAKKSPENAVCGAVGIAPVAHVLQAQAHQGPDQSCRSSTFQVSVLVLPDDLPLPRPFGGLLPSCVCRFVARAH